MKISKLFHWLYATLLFLPVMVIPIFAIYSRNENAQFGYEVTQEVNKAVDFNQQYTNSKYTYNDFVCQPIDNSYEAYNTTTLDRTIYYQFSNLFIENHTYIVKITNSNLQYVDFYVGGTYYYPYQSTPIAQAYQNKFVATNNSALNVNFRTGFLNDEINPFTFSINVFDLTQMGLENITLNEFNQYFPNSTYPYTESQEIVIENYETITYNDTDIGSQMVYTLYNTVNKYFNMSTIFGMDGIGDWILYNILNNNYVLGFTIFWDLLVYWFFISIFWLIFDVMLYVPNLVHRWLDKGALE